MIYEFTHKEKAYKVDDNKLFDKQNAVFREFWSNCDKNLQSGFSIFQNEEISIMVYDRGGVIVDKKQESEVNNG